MDVASPNIAAGQLSNACPGNDVVLYTKMRRRMDPFHTPDNISGFVGGAPHRAVFDYSYDSTCARSNNRYCRADCEGGGRAPGFDSDVRLLPSLDQRYFRARNPGPVQTEVDAEVDKLPR